MVAKTKSPLQEKVQNALQTTWLLKGHLKNAQIAYIRVGVGLAKVRDEKLYEALHHPDLEDYAARRLNLGRASLYRYLQVHDWIKAYHKEWLEAKPKGFIPDLADVADLIWIEKELAKQNLSKEKKSALEKLKEKALSGELRYGDLGKLKRRGHHGDDGLKAFLARFRRLRNQGAGLKTMPADIVSDMDATIEKLVNLIATEEVAMLFDPPKAASVSKYLDVNSSSSTTTKKV